VAQRVLASKPANVDELAKLRLSDADAASIDDVRKALIAKIGENIGVRRLSSWNLRRVVWRIIYTVSRIGVLLEMQGGTPELAKDIAMHVAASKPVCVNESEVPPT